MNNIIRAHLRSQLKVKAQTNLDILKHLKTAQNYDLDLLCKFVGWGTIAPALSGKYPELASQFSELLPLNQDLQSDNAFCTPPSLIESVWYGLEQVGFTSGRILEPASNIGYWKIFQTEKFQKQSEWLMVEVDPTAKQIAEILHPDAIVYGSDENSHRGFEHTIIPKDKIDLVISNFPFGQTSPYDPDYQVSRSLHEYFFEKSIDLVRPGGLVVAVTSTFLLDKITPTFREWMAQNVNLIAALRLPSNTFSELGTNVTADLLILQKPLNSHLLDAAPEWIGTDYFPLRGKTGSWLRMNEYFREHPDHILGQLTPFRLYTGDHLGVDPDPSIDVSHRIVSILSKHKRRYKPLATSAPLRMGLLPPELQGTVPYSFVVWQDKLYQYVGDGDEFGGLRLVNRYQDRILGIMQIADVYERLVNAELEDAIATESLRSELNRTYDAFVKKFGYLSSRTNKSAVSDDPKLFVLSATLEIEEEEEIA